MATISDEIKEYLESVDTETLYQESIEILEGRIKSRDCRTTEISELNKEVVNRTWRMIGKGIREADFDRQLRIYREINTCMRSIDEKCSDESLPKDKRLPKGKHLSRSFEKVFDKTETKIRLLKMLQSGEDEERNSRSRESIAEEFDVSKETINKYLHGLSGETNVLGSTVSLELRRGNNNYDSTIHPVFLALNLTEVYFLTALLRKHFDDTALEYTAANIAYDIYRQLSPYAKEKIDKSGIEFKPEGVDRGYRKEVKTDPAYFLKCGEKVRMILKKDLGKVYVGRVVEEFGRTMLKTEDGTLIDIPAVDEMQVFEPIDDFRRSR